MLPIVPSSSPSMRSAPSLGSLGSASSSQRGRRASSQARALYLKEARDLWQQHVDRHDQQHDRDQGLDQALWIGEEAGLGALRLVSSGLEPALPLDCIDRLALVLVLS